MRADRGTTGGSRAHPDAGVPSYSPLDTTAAVAKQLRVSVRSVRRWQQAWVHVGMSALESKGPRRPGPKPSEASFEVREQELAKGPVAHGWPDQTWTLTRFRTLIGRLSHKSMTLSAIAQMLHRPVVPGRRRVALGVPADAEPVGVDRSVPLVPQRPRLAVHTVRRRHEELAEPLRGVT
jgi:transposase